MSTEKKQHNFSAHPLLFLVKLKPNRTKEKNSIMFVYWYVPLMSIILTFEFFMVGRQLVFFLQFFLHIDNLIFKLFLLDKKAKQTQSKNVINMTRTINFRKKQLIQMLKKILGQGYLKHQFLIWAYAKLYACFQSKICMFVLAFNFPCVLLKIIAYLRNYAPYTYVYVALF